MPAPRGITAAKLGSFLGFLVLLSTSYQLRTEVLALNRIRFAADEARADYERKRLRESYPERLGRDEDRRVRFIAIRRSCRCPDCFSP